MSIAAIVPMRHESERVPGKNYRSFGGKPLFHHIIETLLSVPDIDQVVIDTDSPTIRDDVTERFGRVRVLERPDHLRGGGIPMNEVLLNTCSQIDADWYLQTHSTNPLLKASTIGRAIDTMNSAYPEFDSLFSVTPIVSRFWDHLTRPINHNATILLRTQDLPPVYEENSNIYLFRRDTLERRRNRLGDRPLMFPIERREATDIDEEIDFSVAEFLFLNHQGERG